MDRLGYENLPLASLKGNRQPLKATLLGAPSLMRHSGEAQDTIIQTDFSALWSYSHCATFVILTIFHLWTQSPQSFLHCTKMVAPRDYDRASDDEDENVGMITARKTEYHGTPTSRQIPWWKYTAGAVLFAALLVPAIGYTTSVMLEARVTTAVEKALSSQTNTNTPLIDSNEKQSSISHDIPGEPKFLELSNGTTIEITNPYGGKRFEIHHCGSTADEARALGCAYDVMMQEWTPPACIDWTLAERFLHAGNWTWYADAGAEKIYNATEVALGNHDVVYVAQSYHRHHCIFTWERLVRAMRTQRPLIEKLMSYDHVMHCRMNTLKTFEEGAQAVRGVVAPTAFVRCASLDVWLENLPENEISSIDRLMKML